MINYMLLSFVALMFCVVCYEAYFEYFDKDE